MHEYSLVTVLLQQLARYKSAEGADRVLRIQLQVGEFCGIDLELLRSAFRDLTTGTDLEHVSLDLRRVPLTARCQSCDHEFRVKRFRFICPRCEAKAVTVVRGEELTLESLELEGSFP